MISWFEIKPQILGFCQTAGNLVGILLPLSIPHSHTQTFTLSIKKDF